MGNLLASEIPVNVSNIETYFDDVSGIKFHKNLWRTRFLKTVQAKLVPPNENTQNNNLIKSYDHSHLIEVIAKVFIFNMMDSSIGLPFKVKLTDQRLKLNSIPSCAPYQVILITNRAAILIRQYFYQSIYDRLSTRPFLCYSEKLWLIFLLLQCIENIHDVQVIHGDLKLENIMITTWNWLVVTDFSSVYKPAILSLENPTPNFNYFFDTSRRRNCYLAPERFASTQVNTSYNPDLVSSRNNFKPSTDNGIMSTESITSNIHDGKYSARNNSSSGGMTVDFQLWTNKPTVSMDLFSLGCCIYEIYTDGKVLFDFAQLLQYKNNPKTNSNICSRINNTVDNKYIAETVINLIDINPNNRHSAKQHLEQLREVLFPEYYYSVIYGFHRKFASLKSLLPDNWINELTLDAPLLVQTLDNCSITKDNCHWGYINTLPIVTSNVRRLSTKNSKLSALQLLSLWASKIQSPFILDRILPYVLFFTNDILDCVRSQVPSTLVKVLSCVNSIDKLEDINIFNDYIIPKLVPLASDSGYTVRLAFARCLGKLCEIAFKLWDCGQIYRNLTRESYDLEDGVLKMSHPNLTGEHHQMVDTTASYYDNEMEQNFLNENLFALIDNITQLTTTVLCDKSTTIKRVFLEDSFVTVCVLLFQRQMVTDIITGSTIILHAISVLNDQIDFAMREAFFRIIPDLVDKLGAKLLPVVLPFIEQGLNDFSDWVVSTATESLRKICLITDLTQDDQINLFRMVLPFLSHPNLHIRKITAETLYIMTTKFDCLQDEVELVDTFGSYIDFPMNMIMCKERFFEFCKPPMPKWIFELLLKSTHTSQLFDFVKQVVKFEWQDENSFQQQLCSLLAVQIEPVVRLVNRIGKSYLNNQTDYKHLFNMGDYILRINKLRTIIGFTFASRKKSNSSDGNALDGHIKTIQGIFNLNELTDRQPKVIHHSELVVKSEYNLVSNKSREKINVQTKENAIKIKYFSMKKLDEIRGVRFNHEYMVTQYSLMLDRNLDDEQRFLRKKAISYQPRQRNHRVTSSITSARSLNYFSTQKLPSTIANAPMSTINFNEKSSNQIHQGNTWKICHRIHSLKAHSSFVAAVATSRFENLYASAGYDGNVCVYDMTHTDNGIVNCNTCVTYDRAAGRVNSIQFLDDPNYNEVLCCCSCIESRDVHIFDLDKNLRHKITCNLSDRSYFVDICQLGMMNIPFILGANVNGMINGYDTRIKSNQVSLNFTSINSLNRPSLTKMTVDPQGAWVACGDIQGRIHLWDVRFGCQPVYSMGENINSSCVRALSVHPSKSNLIVSAHESTDQLVKVWDLVDGSLEKVYVTNCPLTNYGLTTTVYNKENYVLFGGSDMCLRSWNLDINRHSCILAAPEEAIVSSNNPDIDDDSNYIQTCKTTHYDFIKSKLAVNPVDTTIEKIIQYTTQLNTPYHLSNAFLNRLHALTSSISIRKYDTKQSRILINGCSDGSLQFYYLK